MKKSLTLGIALLLSISGFSQQDLLTKIEEQGVEIYKLKEELKTEKENSKLLTTQLQNTISNLQKNLTSLIKDSTARSEFIDNLPVIKTQIQQKSDSINLLQQQIIKKDNELNELKTSTRINADSRYIEGKTDGLRNLSKFYTEAKPFDELIQNSTYYSVLRDEQLLPTSEFAEAKSVILDLKRYFESETLLHQKYNQGLVQTALNNLKSISRNSVLLPKQISKLEYYQNFNQGLVACINDIINLDNRESAGDIKEIQSKKLAKILAYISAYVFDYDFNLIDYPYLSEIVIEILKLKQSDADTDISHLIHKLE